MPDRSPDQGVPDDWSHGSHAREPYPAAGAADSYGAGMAGPPGGRAADAYGTAATAAYRTGNADSFRTGQADPFGDAGPFGDADRARTRPADPFGDAGQFRDADSARTRPADPFGDAGQFRDADSARTRPADPFGDAGQFRDVAPFGEGGLFGPIPTDDSGAAAAAEAATAPADGESLTAAIGDSAPGPAAEAKGFLGALFDFGFTSFVTPKVIKVLYTLIMIGTVASAVVFTIIMFRVSTPFGILTLLVADPLFILIVMAIYRMILEFFVVVFRVAEDIRALRERGEPGL